MDETRATAQLPSLDVEILHRRLPEEQAEQLAISLKATPSFGEFARFLERQAPWPWLALQPWLTWSEIVRVAWQPWLEAISVGRPSAAQPPPTAERRLAPGSGSEPGDAGREP